MSIAQRLDWLVVSTVLALATVGQAKPPFPQKEEKKPTSAGHPDPGSFLRWLLLQNGGPDAISVPWPEFVRAATGKQVVPLDQSDATVTAKFGAALDQTLPRLNRPDSAIHQAASLTDGEAAARIGEELRAAFDTGAGITVTALVNVGRYDAAYPAMRCSDNATGKVYYFSVVTFPTGGREGALRAVSVEAAEEAERITADGCCLLVALEHNGKAGGDLAFLNWELIDLAKISVRCVVGFEADEGAVHAPGAVVTDGRKGRD